MNNATIDAGCDNLFIGEVLVFPHEYLIVPDAHMYLSLQPLCLGITGQDCQVTHVVVSGDNCQAIAQAAGTTYDLILAHNPNVNSECTNIYPGEVSIDVCPDDGRAIGLTVIALRSFALLLSSCTPLPRLRGLTDGSERATGCSD